MTADYCLDTSFWEWLSNNNNWAEPLTFESCYARSLGGDVSPWTTPNNVTELCGAGGSPFLIPDIRWDPQIGINY